MIARRDIVIVGAGIGGIAARAISRLDPDLENLLVDNLRSMSLTSRNLADPYRNWWLDERLAEWIHRSIERIEAIASSCGNGLKLNARGYAYVYTTAEGAEEAGDECWAYSSKTTTSSVLYLAKI